MTASHEQVRYTAGGVPVYSFLNPALHGFCLSLCVRAGSMFETEEENGISHFLEHLAIRNVNARWKGELYRFLDRKGLNLNACTYREYVQFTITGATAHFLEAADVLTQVMAPLVLSSEEIVIERNRIKAEIREDGEENTLHCYALRAVWEGTSLERTIAGKPGGLNRMGKQILSQAHARFFSAGNVFFYVTGHTSERNLAALCRYADRFPLTEGVSIRKNIAPLPVGFRARDAQVIFRARPNTSIFFSFDIDPSRCTRQELVLLYDILFMGESSLVYQRLSEKTGLIYSYDSYLEQYDNAGSLHFYYDVRPARLQEAVRLTAELLRELCSEAGKLLDYVRPVYVDNAAMALDDAENFGIDCVYRHILDDGVEPSIEARAKAYASVTPERIEALARDLFRPENAVAVVYGDPDKVDTAAIRAQLRMLNQG